MLLDDARLIFKTTQEKELLDLPIFKLFQTQRLSPEGTPMSFYLVKAPDWANVIPLTRNDQGEDCFLMVRQFRHGSGQVTLEFPGGMIDPGENPEQAALRELREETGFHAGRLVKIGHVNPNPAFMTNTLHTFLAWDLEARHEQDLDVDERVHFELISAERVYKEMGNGIFNHGIMLIALWWYEKWKREVRSDRS